MKILNEGCSSWVNSSLLQTLQIETFMYQTVYDYIYRCILGMLFENDTAAVG